MSTPSPSTPPGGATTPRRYQRCNSARAAELLRLSAPSWEARRTRATLWFELGSDGPPIAVGKKPKGRPADAPPLIGLAPIYCGVCLPGTTWVFDERAVLASVHDPLYAAAIAAQPARTLLAVAMQMHALLEDGE